MNQYALLGGHTSNSLSPAIHSAFAQQASLSIKYCTYDVQKQQFQSFMTELSQQHSGVNITSPFKNMAYHWVSQCSPRAWISQSVNTVCFKNGRSYGDNTDGIGWIKSMQSIDHQCTGNKILILGAGGAISALLPSMLQKNPAAISLLVRDVNKASKALKHIHAILPATTQLMIQPLTAYTTVQQTTFDLIINACSDHQVNLAHRLHSSAYSTQTLCYDLHYHTTAFADWCNIRSLPFYNGLRMLVEQAAEAFFLWQGVSPQIIPVYTQLSQQILTEA